MGRFVAATGALAGAVPAGHGAGRGSRPRRIAGLADPQKSECVSVFALDCVTHFAHAAKAHNRWRIGCVIAFAPRKPSALPRVRACSDSTGTYRPCAARGDRSRRCTGFDAVRPTPRVHNASDSISDHLAPHPRRRCRPRRHCAHRRLAPSPSTTLTATPPTLPTPPRCGEKNHMLVLPD